jgi:serralysin
MDTFVFNTGLNAKTNLDHITDFDPGSDKIQLGPSIFNVTPDNGHLLANEFFSWPGANTAHLPNDRIIYNATSGALFYDRDGSDRKYSAIEFAVLDTHPTTISSTDFLVA